MESPGEYLKRERELRRASLMSIFEATRVPLKCLEALEADDYDSLPHPTFVKGFIKSYCKRLGLDETDAVLRYELYMKERSDRSEPARTALSINRKELKDFSKEGRSFVNLWGIAAVAGIALAVILTYSLYARHKARVSLLNEAARQTASVAAPAALAGPDKGAPAAGLATAGADKKHTLVINATEVVWIKARIDGGEPFDVVLKKGERIVWRAANSFSLVIGNAGGVNLVYDGDKLQPLGKSGEVATLKLPRA